MQLSGNSQISSVQQDLQTTDKALEHLFDKLMSQKHKMPAGTDFSALEEQLNDLFDLYIGQARIQLSYDESLGSDAKAQLALDLGFLEQRFLCQKAALFNGCGDHTKQDTKQEGRHEATD